MSKLLRDFYPIVTVCARCVRSGGGLDPRRVIPASVSYPDSLQKTTAVPNTESRFRSRAKPLSVPRVDTARSIPTNPAEHDLRRRDGRAVAVPGRKSLKISIIGSPNVGKSVLTNALVGAKISAVSKKVHTTRKLVTGLAVQDETQLVLWDTPGVIDSLKAKQHQLEDSLLLSPETSLQKTDLILVVVDAGFYKQTRLDPDVLHLLYRYNGIKSILVLNKVDLVKGKSRLLSLVQRLTKGIVGGMPIATKKPDILAENKTDDTIVDDTFPSDEKSKEALNRILSKPLAKVMHSDLRRCFREEKGWPNFDYVFMVSALHGDGLEDLKSYLMKMAVEREHWPYHASMLTDQSPQNVVKDLIRGKLMDLLLNEIPYKLKYQIAVWEVNDQDVLCIRINIVCEEERWLKLIIGPAGKIIHNITIQVNQEVGDLFQRDVYVKLGVISNKKKY